MKHHLLVLHFGAQCPWYRWVIRQAQGAAQALKAEVVVRDVTVYPELAEEHRMFFPFMTVIDGKLRIPSPVRAEALAQMAREIPELKPTVPMAYGHRAARCEVQALTPDNVKATIPLCIAGVEPIADREKARWARDVLRKSRTTLFGFIAYKDGEAKGAVEYLPSHLVPYPLPQKDPSIAFITCIYPTEPASDYKSPVLEKLLDHLRVEGYRRLQVIAGRRTPFPNGPTAFFREHGFIELEELDRIGLTEGKEELILMEKEL